MPETKPPPTAKFMSNERDDVRSVSLAAVELEVPEDDLLEVAQFYHAPDSLYFWIRSWDSLLTMRSGNADLSMSLNDLAGHLGSNILWLIGMKPHPPSMPVGFVTFTHCWEAAAATMRAVSYHLFSSLPGLGCLINSRKYSP